MIADPNLLTDGRTLIAIVAVLILLHVDWREWRLYRRGQQSSWHGVVTCTCAVGLVFGLVWSGIARHVAEMVPWIDWFTALASVSGLYMAVYLLIRHPGDKR